MTRSLAASLCPSSADGKEDGPGVLKGVRPRPKMGQCQSSLMSQQLREAIRYLDKPWGDPNWQCGAQSHLYSLSSGVQHHYKIYLSWSTLWGRDWLPHFKNRYRNSKPLDLWHPGHLYPSQQQNPHHLFLRLAYVCPRPYYPCVRHVLEILSKLILHGWATD